MNVAFRVDASTRIGMGHLMRCISLAEALAARGASVKFICREQEGDLAELVTTRGFGLEKLPAGADDADLTIKALRGIKPDWLVVDHYGISKAWERRLRPHVGQLMVIDDLADRAHECDVLLDQNYARDPTNRYEGLVDAGCRLLLGPRYALLAQEYLYARRSLSPRARPAKTVLVFFGGTDPSNATALALEALSQEGLRSLEAHVVLGPNNPHRKSVEQLAHSRGHTVLYGAQPNLATLIREADIAIGAGGTATWERMCLGLPSVVVSIADNQEQACESLAHAGLILYPGRLREVGAEKLAGVLRGLVSDPARLAQLGERAAACVDGLGAARVAEALFPSPLADLRVQGARDAVPTRAGSFRFDVVTSAGAPIARVNVDAGDDGMLIDWQLDPIVGNRLWEAPIVDRAMRRAQAAAPRVAGQQAERQYFIARKSAAAGRRYSIAILSDRSSWLNPRLADLGYRWLQDGHRVLWAHDSGELRPGDFCFLLGCAEILPPELLARFKHTLVVHESDLPRGRGWSPLTWQILEGANRIPVTLLEAARNVDAGRIYGQAWLTFKGHELVDELRSAVARATLELCDAFVREYPSVIERAHEQSGEATRYPRRTPQDSRLDPEASIGSQFGLLRVVDNDRYPAFFELGGHRYRLRIERSPE